VFFCEECRIENEWHKSFGGSNGRCEVCAKTASCYDIPSRYLPIPKRPQ
jgi:hypothetical protein